MGNIETFNKLTTFSTGIDSLLRRLKDYSNEDVMFIERAYFYARRYHEKIKQRRLSGEPYIVHPLRVACKLSSIHADAEAIAAGLLHDVVEDCEVDLSEISQQFNEPVAGLVDDLTKIKKVDVADPNYREDVNLEKTMKSMTRDIRGIMIKAIDREDNMETMEYQSADKQYKKSIQTLGLYVHLCYLLGEYDIKNRLEELSFYYAYPEKFEKITVLKNLLLEYKRKTIDEKVFMISRELREHGFDGRNFEVELEFQHAYGMYRRLKKVCPEIDELLMQVPSNIDEILKSNTIPKAFQLLLSIDDIIKIKVKMAKKEECYAACDEITKGYKVIDSKTRDYIARPKTNRYMGLHKSVITEDNTIMQLQFKTPQMDVINRGGITEYWKLLTTNEKVPASQQMQDEARKMQCYQFIDRIGKDNLSTSEYAAEIRSDILSKMIYIDSGEPSMIELPEKSTIIDYAFRKDPNTAPYIMGATVNGEQVDLNYVLESNDKVELEYGDSMVNLNKVALGCHTHYAKRKINSLLH